MIRIKKLSILLLCMVLLTSCSIPKDFQMAEKVEESNNEISRKAEAGPQHDKEIQVDESLKQWYGEWVGANSSYHRRSQLSIKPISDNLIEFNLNAYNGCRTGGYDDTTKIVNGKAIHKTEDGVEFIFSLDKEGRIQLQSNNYTYYCGAGVSFDSVYVKELNIQPPTAIEAGLVDTDEQEKIFKDLTGDMYDTFIDYAQFYFDEESNYKNYRIRTFGLLSWSDIAVVMLDNKRNHIIAAIDSGEGVHYYTNDKDWHKKPPKFIEEWLGGRHIVNIETEELSK
ncbi:hypothetical protein R9X47_24455 [Wukongibacter baidiensis]|uniref:hypothetical protein n=1 Tax=Wukongibacter baidiensis TaxID=1723361 RepID=UPI003D7F4CF7